MMAMATTLALAGADEDTFVPNDYTEMVTVYKKYVEKLVRKYNRVTSNFEDLLQHTWTKLVEVEVLRKYHLSTGNQARHITGDQAAKYMKMSWPQYKVFMWRAHMGDKRPVLQNGMVAKILERDAGICRNEVSHASNGGCCDTVEFSRALKVLQTENPEEYRKQRKQLKDRFSIAETTWQFWGVEVVDEHAKGADKFKTVCLFCQAWKREAAKQTVQRSKSSMLLTPVSGTWGSKKALYDVVDVEKMKIRREENDRCKAQPGYEAFVIPQTKSRFKLYLARAVHNIYANWCRTRSRKYKELYLSPNEAGQAWESFLEDDGHNDPEAKLIVTEEVNANVDKVVDKLQRKVREGKITRELIEDRLAKGHTISEILKEFELPRAVLQVVTGRYG